MAYFDLFPKLLYTLDKKNDKLTTDLFRRLKIRSSILSEASLYDVYDVQEGDTPESIAFKHFGDTELHWVILILNNITDRFYDWPLTSYEFNEYLNNKYENIYDIHHYEIDQLSGPTMGLGPSDYSTKIQVNSDYPGATVVTNYDYEQRIQDQKRQIKILNPAYLNLMLDEFQKLISK
jgi:hypothetical protein